MSLPIEIGESVAGLSVERASALHARIDASRGGRLVLGVPAGRTLVPVIEALVEKLRAEPLPLDHIVFVLMDDYALPTDDGGWRIPSTSAHYSCRRFGEWMLAELNEAVSPLAGIPTASLWSPDPSEPESYDAAIAGIGGVDLFYVAVGASDGHVAFNPPGTAIDSRTRIIPLAESTRRDNLGTFPEFESLSDVPTHGVSVGLASIADAREIEMIAFGDNKTAAIARLRDATDFDPAWPATFAYRHPAVTLYVDRAAAGVATV
ncbi:hypothetical protein [Herbiconiux sp. L3-i23]|uniref:hypothetical protein n=1 Tax=Herbiconiux sp. L3-i23 TaxID=2905871 RepID=UPI00206EEAD5|nr:hypothetical protein [Herbiconiux sp. L3-i23]BDI22175.1 glucosamine-6-phosphate deaminase [Herbiconiux sp. L3-i23]